MRIIDAHAHVFEVLAGFGTRGELRAIGGGKARWANGDIIAMIPPGMGEYSFTADTLATFLKTNGVEKAVLLQGSFYGFQNHYTWQSAEKYPDLFIPSGTFDPFCNSALALADQMVNQRKLPVIKFEASSGGGLMAYHRTFALDGEVFSEIFDLIAKAGSTLVLDIGSPGMPSFQPQAVANVAKRHPEMRIVVCHLLAPTLKDEQALKDGLRTLALPNVWFDLAAVPWNVAPEQYPYPTGQRFVAIAKEIVGSDKLLWGSDVPSVLTRDSYIHLIDYIANSGIFSQTELERVMALNAIEAYAIQS